MLHNVLMTGEAYFKLSELTSAEFWYREALRIKPDHIPAHLTLAKLLHRQVGSMLIMLAGVSWVLWQGRLDAVV